VVEWDGQFRDRVSEVDALMPSRGAAEMPARCIQAYICRDHLPGSVNQALREIAFVVRVKIPDQRSIGVILASPSAIVAGFAGSLEIHAQTVVRIQCTGMVAAPSVGRSV
jgi:hypothetical protein